MYAHEMSAETLTEPVAGLGLYEPCFPAVAVYVPCVQCARDVECPLRCEARFDTNGGAEHGIVEQVAFYSYVLGAGVKRITQCKE